MLNPYFVDFTDFSLDFILVLLVCFSFIFVLSTVIYHTL